MVFIEIFLAASVSELREEREELGNFIRSLNDCFMHRGIYFRMNMSAEATKTPGDCDYFYVIFFRKAEPEIIEAFDEALKKFKDAGAPKITTFFKDVEGDISEEVLCFMERLDKELQHFYTMFRSVDTLKLKLLLEFCRKPENQIKMEFRDAAVLLDGQLVEGITLENLPFYSKHEALAHLRRQINRLEGAAEQARKAFREDPDNIDLLNRYADCRSELNSALEQLHAMEMQLLETSSRLSQLTEGGESITHRTRKAIELFEQGKMEEALSVLDEEEFQRDLQRAEEKATAVHRELEALLGELTAKISILKARDRTLSTAGKIRKLYEQAWELIVAYRLKPECLVEYLDFLWDQNDFDAATRLAEQLEHELGSRENVPQTLWARFRNSVAILYSITGHTQEAEKLFQSEIQCLRSLAEKVPDLYEPALATSCCNLGTLYQKNHKHKEAEQLYLEALKIRRHWSEVMPTIHKADLAHCLNNLANLYYRTGRLREAEQLHREALKIRWKLFSYDQKAHARDFADSCNGLALVCQKTGQVDEALDLFEEALETRRWLAEENPEVYHQDLADVCRNLAGLYLDRGSTEEAEALYQEALKIYRCLVRKYPQIHEPALAELCHDLAVLSENTWRITSAISLHEEALEIRRRLAAKDPRVYEGALAQSCCSMGYMYSQLGAMKEAEQLHAEAMEIRRRFVAEDPRTYTESLAISCINYAIVFAKTQRPEQAEQLFLEALELRCSLVPENPAGQKQEIEKLFRNLETLYRQAPQLGDKERLLQLQRDYYRKLRQMAPDVFGPS